MCCKAMGAANEDLWGDEEDTADGQSTLDREWLARREEHFSSGYREGLEAGKHETVQAGFNEGYRAGAAAGFETGAARGAALSLRALAPRLPPDLASRLQDAQQEQEQQLGGQQQLLDIPYQQLQQKVCSSLMAAQSQSQGCGSEQCCRQAASEQCSEQAAALPSSVQAAVHSVNATLQALSLHSPTQGHTIIE